VARSVFKTEASR